jgi:uncharacterized membrane protein
MGHIRIPHYLDAPIEHVWEVACDATKTIDWATWFTSFEPTDRFAAVGQQFHGTGRILGRDMEFEGRIAEFEPLRLIAFEGTQSLGHKWSWRNEFRPSGEGTDLDLTYDYDTPGALLALFDRVLVERAIDRNFHASVETFHDLVLAKAPQPA